MAALRAVQVDEDRSLECFEVHAMQDSMIDVAKKEQPFFHGKDTNQTHLNTFPSN